MIELLRTNDPVFISWLTSVFSQLDIRIIVLDEHTSNLEGNISAIQRRVMVGGDDFGVARLTFETAIAELDDQVGAYEYPE